LRTVRIATALTELRPFEASLPVNEGPASLTILARATRYFAGIGTAFAQEIRQEEHRLSILFGDEPTVLRIRAVKTDGRENFEVSIPGLEPILIDPKAVVKDADGGIVSASVSVSEIITLIRGRDLGLETEFQTASVNGAQDVVLVLDPAIARQNMFFIDLFLIAQYKEDRRDAKDGRLELTLSEGATEADYAMVRSRIEALEASRRLNGIGALFTQRPKDGFVRVNVTTPGNYRQGERNIVMMPSTEDEVPSLSAAILRYFRMLGQVSQANLATESWVVRGYEIVTGQTADAQELGRVIMGLAGLELRLRYAIRPLMKVVQEKLRQYQQNLLAVASAA
jgi:hypothetical protein